MHFPKLILFLTIFVNVYFTTLASDSQKVLYDINERPHALIDLKENTHTDISFKISDQDDFVQYKAGELGPVYQENVSDEYDPDEGGDPIGVIPVEDSLFFWIFAGLIYVIHKKRVFKKLKVTDKINNK